MLNISPNNKINLDILKKYSVYSILESQSRYKIINSVLLITLCIVILFLFFPWTQNIQGAGTVTTLKPYQRPQTIQNIISGKIEKWYVNEGDFVKAGDTIVFISEIKEDYLDPNLLQNTKNQVNAKENASNSYQQKVNALEYQLSAIVAEKDIKLKQAQNKLKQTKLKIKSDSIDLEAIKIQLNIAQTQYNRTLALNKEGLKPTTALEDKRVKLQELQAKAISQENKYLTSKNEALNASMDLNRIAAEYNDKIAKSTSEKQTALSSKYDTDAQVSKLKNIYENYKIRNGLYYITAPQNGYINRALQTGLGETIKEGTPIVSIMPSNYEIAVETYISPLDFPLIKKGNKVRIWFDGWPTIVFSGWPNMSYGTFGGKVIAIENFISPNGKYRVLIAPDPKEPQWANQLSLGSGPKTIALLSNVPIWFEIWRTLNGFPKNYYDELESKTDNKK